MCARMRAQTFGAAGVSVGPICRVTPTLDSFTGGRLSTTPTFAPSLMAASPDRHMSSPHPSRNPLCSTYTIGAGSLRRDPGGGAWNDEARSRTAGRGPRWSCHGGRRCRTVGYGQMVRHGKLLLRIEDLEQRLAALTLLECSTEGVVADPLADRGACCTPWGTAGRHDRPRLRPA